MWTPLFTSILVVWCVKLLSAILKYVKYSAVLENSFPASQLRLEVNRGVRSLENWPLSISLRKGAGNGQNLNLSRAGGEQSLATAFDSGPCCEDIINQQNPLTSNAGRVRTAKGPGDIALAGGSPALVVCFFVAVKKHPRPGTAALSRERGGEERGLIIASFQQAGAVQGDGNNQITRGQQPPSCLGQPPGHQGRVLRFVPVFEAQDEALAGLIINKHRATTMVGGAFVQTRAAEDSLADCLERQTTERTDGGINKAEGRPTLWTKA